MRSWWARRPLRTRITLVVGVVSLVSLLALVRLAGGLLFSAVVSAGDAELRGAAATAAEQVRSAGPAAPPLPPPVRVVDTAGAPVDGRGPRPVADDVLAELAAGDAVTVAGPDGTPRRWVAVPVTVADGSTRLVLDSRDLIGAVALLAGAAPWILIAALVAAAAVTGAAWVGTRAALAPVDRMRAAAAALPPGARLPVPPAGDELHALAAEFNALLARRDEAVARLERFTGDAAHELRSPLAALRAQADVAVAYPAAADEETWRSVADEAARMSSLLADLLALARADAGERPPARAVDLVAAAREAVDRGGADEPAPTAVTLWAPVPARVAATEPEVALVLDNLLANGRRHARSVVHVSVVPAGSWVRLVVDDDGPGIAAEDRERVFDRFLRLDPAGGNPAGGDGPHAGLGLALVVRLVEGRGGTVRATASPEGGARLTARWPTAS